MSFTVRPPYGRDMFWLEPVPVSVIGVNDAGVGIVYHSTAVPVNLTN